MQMKNGPQKQGFGSNYYYWTDFRNSNGIYSGSIEAMTENCCRWKSTSSFDGQRHFAYNLRTNETNFEIQTAYVKVQLQWLIKFCRFKSTSGFGGKWLFAYDPRTKTRFFWNSNGKCSGLIVMTTCKFCSLKSTSGVNRKFGNGR